jgi:hypothetical protein
MRGVRGPPAARAKRPASCLSARAKNREHRRLAIDSNDGLARNNRFSLLVRGAYVLLAGAFAAAEVS